MIPLTLDNESSIRNCKCVVAQVRAGSKRVGRSSFRCHYSSIRS